MKRYLICLLFTIQSCVPAFAAVDEKTTAAYAPSLRVTKNFVKNTDCEKNALGITASAGSVVPSASSPVVTGAGSMCRWNPGGTGTLKFDIGTLSPNVKAGNCEASFYAGMVSTGEFVAYLEYDSVQITSDLAINATVVGQKFSISAPCSSTATARKLVFKAVVSPGTPLYVGGVSFGENLNIGNYSVASDWQDYTPIVTTASGTITNYTVVGQWRQIADSIEVKGKIVFTGSPGTWSAPSVSLPSGKSINTSKMETTTALSGDMGGVKIRAALTHPGSIDYGTTTSLRLRSFSTTSSIVQADSLTDSIPVTFASGNEITWHSKPIPITGLSSTQTAASVAQTLNLMGAVFYVGSSTCPAGSLAADGTAVSRTGYAQLFNSIGTTFGTGDGSTTFNLPDARGIFIRGAGSQTISAITYSGTLGTKQGDQFQGHKHNEVVNGGSGATNMPQNVAGTSATEISVATGTPITDGTNGTPRTGSETRPANISLTACISYLNVLAPLYIGSVSSNTSGSERIERVAFGGASSLGTNCTSGSCTIQSQTGSWVSSVSWAASGTYTVSFASGMFSGPPVCYGGGRSNGNNIQAPAFLSPSSSSVSVVIRNTSGTTVDGEISMTCMGPR